MPRGLRDKVVVITGASSGIGRASALEFARRGAAVVLAARRVELLEEVAAECERVGGRALSVPTDVTDEGAVRDLAHRAAATFGRIDVWVNNAGVTLFAPFEEAPADAFRQVVETNLFGYVHGARAALPYFREQGHGVLINNASQDAAAAEPHVSAYAMSKAAIRSLGDALRMETRDSGIHVCTVLPAAIDTPLFQHAANYTGRAVRPPPPVYPVDRVVRRIVDLAEKPEREAFVGGAARMNATLHGLFPGLFERVLAKPLTNAHFQGDKPAAPTEGNLFEPMAQGAGSSGGWRSGRPARRRLSAAVLGLAVTGVTLAGLLRRRRHRAPGRPT